MSFTLKPRGYFAVFSRPMASDPHPYPFELLAACREILLRSTDINAVAGAGLLLAEEFEKFLSESLPPGPWVAEDGPVVRFSSPADAARLVPEEWTDRASARSQQ